MDKEDYGYVWDDYEMGYGREVEILYFRKLWSSKEDEKKKKGGKKFFKLWMEKCLRLFSLDVFFFGKYVYVCVMYCVISKVVVVVSINVKEFCNNLKLYKDFIVCKVVGEILVLRVKEVDVFMVVYEFRKGEKFEGCLVVVVYIIEDNGINVDMD